MLGFVNDLLRQAIGYAIVLFGLLMTAVQRLRISSFKANQNRLRRKYNITTNTPIVSYGEEVVRRIETLATRAGDKANFALTSGSTGEPKRFLYTPARLRALKLTFSEVFARACWSLRLRRTSLYVFNSFTADASLTSMLLDEGTLPSYMATLQAPYRLQPHEEIQRLAGKYGSTAVRLWLLTISNPGVLYSTNPSTISTFLDELVLHWARSSQLVKDWYENRNLFGTEIQKIVRRIDSRGSSTRLGIVAASNVALPLESFAPGVTSYICWTGGYVKPFLERLEIHLPSPRYRLIPMYSMSTETIETVTHFDRTGETFLPVAPGVLYEFIEKDHPEKPLPAHELQPGETYAMVVSDQYGLRRYHTGDLFRCESFVSGLPDLRFMHRRNIEYSFTGEKVTSAQVSAMFAGVRREFPLLAADTFLSCVPSQPPGAPVPHYKVLVLGTRLQNPNGLIERIATHCDKLLCEMNCEYANKRASGRLGEIRVMAINIQDLAKQLGRGDGWETQFKFLPLYQQTWESGVLQFSKQ